MGRADRRLRICLITPGHLATDPRLVKEADALSEAGYEVSVIAGRFIAWADEADRGFEKRPWKARRIAFGTMAGSVQRVAQGLRNRAALLAVRALGHGSASLPTAFHPVVPALMRAACECPADLYIAHNLAALPAAYAAARQHGARLGFDAEDFHGGELPDTPENAFRTTLSREMERRYLPHCDCLTASSPGIAQAYAKEYGLSLPTVVLNVFGKAEAPPAPTERGTVEPGPSLYWFSQTIGPDRGLEAVVEALALTSSRPTLYLRGNPAGGYRQFLEELAARKGVAGRVMFLPPAAPGEMVRMAAGFDIGLSTEVRVSRNKELCLSNKLFTYILAGVPVLVSSTKAQADAAKGMPGAAFVFAQGDPRELARITDNLLLPPKALAEARAGAWRLGQTRFNWEFERQAFVARIAEAFREPQRRP